jgi:class 3 adenylate cyclase
MGAGWAGRAGLPAGGQRRKASGAPARARLLAGTLVGLALVVGALATLDRHRAVGRPFPGFMVLDTLLVGVGGAERGGLLPFDLVRAVNGQLLRSGRELQAEVLRHPPGTPLRYLLSRRGQLVEAEVATRLYTLRDFKRFVVEGLVAGLLYLGLGVLVFYLQPGVWRSWLFLAFSLCWFLITVAYADAHHTYRFTPLFMTAWAFSPAIYLHLALTFPQRRTVVRLHPRVVWLPYLASAVIALLLQRPLHPLQYVLVPGLGAAYWILALSLLIAGLVRTAVSGPTPLVRQRARVLAVGFAVGEMPGVLGTAIEAVFRVPVPYLNELWKLNFAFPATVAYAMVRYNLFDVRSALRLGTIYSVVTGLVVAAYAGAIALLDLFFGSFELRTSPFVPATVVALAVVMFLNPVYRRTQRVVDRLFFRERADIQQSVEHLAEVMTSLLDLHRIVGLVHETVERLLHPARQALLIHDAAGQAYVLADRDAGDGALRVSVDVPLRIPADAAVPRCLGIAREPLTRERLEEDPAFAADREACLAGMATLGAELVVPIVFQERLTGLLVLGPKRSGAAYTSEDVRLLRLLANQSAVALEHARAYAALEAANAELKTALRRVEILESVRANLSKFVPRTVQTLIEQAPEAPELAKREADVSVLFVDIVGYTRLSERLDPERVTQLVERYFGSFLDEILKRGGDVNETAGDGLMVIFQDPDGHRHARAAVKCALNIVRRTHEINAKLADLGEPIQLHLGVNSGLATVGATKIEGMSGTRWVYTASGSVTNVAARLAALGDADAIMLGPETRSRLGGEFDLEDLGEQRLRNVEQPVRVFRLLVPTAVPAA